MHPLMMKAYVAPLDICQHRRVQTLINHDEDPDGGQTDYRVLYETLLIMFWSYHDLF